MNVPGYYGQVLEDGKWRDMTDEDLAKVPHDYLLSMQEVRRDAYHEHRELDHDDKEMK